MSAPVPAASALAGFDPDLVKVDSEEGSATVEIDESIYPLEAVYAAAYALIDRAYVWLDRGLDRTGEMRLRVRLTSPAVEGDDLVGAGGLRSLVGDFANELLTAAWRQRLTVQNQTIIEATTARAMAGAMGPPTLEELATFDFTGEPFADPLGIAIPWEEKYGKAAKAADGAAERAADVPDDDSGTGEKSE